VEDLHRHLQRNDAVTENSGLQVVVPNVPGVGFQPVNLQKGNEALTNIRQFEPDHEFDRS